MDITYNGLTSPTNLVTFTDIPNILSIDDYSIGSKAEFSFEFENTGGLYNDTSENNQWYITFNGETISNVINPDDANGKSFYISTSTTSTAASVAKALRSCPGVIANWTVEHGWHYPNEVKLIARNNGSIFGNSFGSNASSTNIDSDYLTRSGSDGSGGALTNSIITVDIYDTANDIYITSLEKNFYNGQAVFNMSPALTSLAEEGKTYQYSYRVGYQKDGDWQYLGAISDNYIVPGYMVNQGLKYIPLTSVHLAQNVSRGTEKGGNINRSLLYIYEPSLTFSVYMYNTGGFDYTIYYLDSKYSTISASTGTYHSTGSDNKLKDIELLLDEELLRQSFYIDVEVGNSFTLRYNVIKPLKATEYCQRLYFRNSYGGISFIDLTGQRSETRDLEQPTYQKNIYDYYQVEMNELEIPYDNSIDYKFTLKSHIFENDGKYIYNDLLQSPKVWTTINGENYRILIDSISVDEQENNNLFEAQVKYHLSQTPAII